MNATIEHLAEELAFLSLDEDTIMRDPPKSNHTRESHPAPTPAWPPIHPHNIVPSSNTLFFPFPDVLMTTENLPPGVAYNIYCASQLLFGALTASIQGILAEHMGYPVMMNFTTGVQFNVLPSYGAAH
jgi:hypothetical protein